MLITYSIIMHLLLKRIPAQNVADRIVYPDIPLKSVRLYHGQAPDGGRLYITDEMPREKQVKRYAGCVFLFCGNIPSDKFELPEGAAYIRTGGHSDKYTLLDEISDIFQTLQEWDCSLIAAIKNGAPLSEFFALGQPVLNRACAMVSRNFSLVAYSPGSGGISEEGSQSQPLALPKAINELIKDEQFHQAGSNEGLFVYPSYPCDERYLCCNVFSGKQYVARLISPISPDEKASDKGAAQLFLHFCNYAAELYLRYADDRYVRHQNDRLHQLVKTIIQQPGERSAKKAESVLRDYGWEMSHSYSVVKLRFFEGVEPEGTALYLSKQLLSEWPHSCALSLENCIVWVVNLTLSETRLAVQSFDQSLAYIVREYVCKAGISDLCNDFLNLRSYYIQAEAALEIGQKRDPHFWNYRFDSYILAYMLEQMTGDFSGEQLCSKALYTLREYDMKYNTEYSKTLYYYISCRFNISLAAKKMYVHRTTFIRRLERIREISGIDIDNADELLHLLLSYKLLES